MRHMGTTSRFVALAAGITVMAGLAPGADKNAKSDKNTKEIMNSFIGALSAVLPLSFDTDEFGSAKNRDAVRKHLQTLKDNAHALDAHGSSGDRGFNFVARSLEDDVRNVARWYEKGMYGEAKFTLHNMTENCISCHSSLPEAAKFPRPAAFFKSIDLAGMPPLERAHYQTMTRQFDEAMDSYEAVMKDPDIRPVNLVALGAMTNYLKLAINVKGDFKRPQAVLTQIQSRAGTADHVQQLVAGWVGDLQKYEKEQAFKSITLDGIKKAVNAGKMQMDFPHDRQGLIHYVTANAMAARYIGNKPSPADAAEAYYLMGVTESLLGSSFWISKQDYYLETAIRLAPGATFSAKAYALLEENLIAGYTGSSGTHLPDDVRDLLKELKGLITRAKKEGKNI